MEGIERAGAAAAGMGEADFVLCFCLFFENLFGENFGGDLVFIFLFFLII